MAGRTPIGSGRAGWAILHCRCSRRTGVGGDCHGVWRSLVARFVRDEEAAGSNPVTPTMTVLLVPLSHRSDKDSLGNSRGLGFTAGSSSHVRIVHVPGTNA